MLYNLLPYSVFILVFMLSLLAAFAYDDGKKIKKIRARITSFREDKRQTTKNFAESFLAFFGKMFQPRNLAKRDEIESKLTYAGYNHPDHVRIYYGIRFLFFTFCLLSAASLAMQGIDIIWCIAIILASYFLPSLFLAQRMKKRDIRIFKELPDMLDLLVSCVEAGLSFEMALLEVSKELKDSTPILSKESSHFFYETQSGINREEALLNITKRNSEKTLAGIVNVILQSFRFGTDIAGPLRIHSKILRTERMQKAEEKASMVGVKLSLPLVLLILPVLLLVLVGPAFLTLYDKGFFKIFKF